MNILKFEPSASLLQMAEYFSDNWEKLSFGCYSSDDNNYHIEYMEKIRDKKTNQLVNTSIRIGHTSGIIEISKFELMKLEITKNYIYFLILWCVVQQKTDKLIESDILTLQYYLTTGRPVKDIILGYVKLFKPYNNELNHKRIKAIDDFLKNNNNDNGSNKRTRILL